MKKPDWWGYAYPITNLRYMQDVNEWVVEHNPGASANVVSDTTKNILEKATLYNAKNAVVKKPSTTGAFSMEGWNGL